MTFICLWRHPLPDQSLWPVDERLRFQKEPGFVIAFRALEAPSLCASVVEQPSYFPQFLRQQNIFGNHLDDKRRIM